MENAREKRLAYQRAWYQANRERQREINRKRYQEKKYLWKNPDGSWRVSQTPERRNELARARYAKDPAGWLAAAKVRRDNKRIFGVCVICTRAGRLYRDHNHTTGRWRDKICHHCNLLIGHAYESRETLISAAQYLETHEQ